MTERQEEIIENHWRYGLSQTVEQIAVVASSTVAEVIAFLQKRGYDLTHY